MALGAYPTMDLVHGNTARLEEAHQGGLDHFLDEIAEFVVQAAEGIQDLLEFAVRFLKLVTSVLEHTLRILEFSIRLLLRGDQLAQQTPDLVNRSGHLNDSR